MLKTKAETILLISKLKKMGIQKMSLANIKGKLSRAEMKNIMAGSGCYPNNQGDCNLNQAACVFAGKSGKARDCGSSFCCCC